jgi:acetolactate decarboxylase
VRIFPVIASLSLLASFAAAPVAAQSESTQSLVVVQQIGTYDYLAGPNYQGLLPIREIFRDAEIGLGTFANLDGEMVVLDGVVFRVGTDGVPRQASTKRLTPFMQVVDFDAERSMRVAPNTACSALPPLIDTLAKTTQGIVAVKLSGVFFDIELRSVPAQVEPFPSLVEVIGTQIKFPLGRVNATLVGFRQGPDAQGIGAPGLHLHGLTKSKGAGGHVLSCVTGPRVLLEVQKTQGVRVYTPQR